MPGMDMLRKRSKWSLNCTIGRAISVANSSNELPHTMMQATWVEMSVFEAEHWLVKTRMPFRTTNHLKLIQNLTKLGAAPRISKGSKPNTM